MKSFVLPVLWAALSSLGFSMMFGLRSKKLLYVAIGGAITWLSYLVSMKIGVNEVMAYAVAAGLGTVFSEIMARAIKTPVTAFVIPVNIPLVPGASLYYSLLAMWQKDFDTFLDKGKYTAAVACAMALGILVSTMLFRLIKTGLDKRRARA
ncbi:MAG: threonine/serine exporter family protein [Clostridia bacterium]|nr:threonine/serine exporter family protein [Clostridia bacterium]